MFFRSCQDFQINMTEKLKKPPAIEETKQQITINDLIDFFDNFLKILSSSIDDILNYAQSNHIKDIKQYESIILKQINKRSTKKEINDFLNIAKNDLKDYKNLMEKKSYPNAIYHLQQSVEKTIKSMCFFLFVDFKPRSVGHDFSNIMLLLKKDGVLSDLLKEFIIRFENKLNKYFNYKIKIFGNTKIDLSNFWIDIDNKIFLRDFKKRMIEIFSENSAGVSFFLLMFLNFKKQIKETSDGGNKISLYNILYSSELFIFHMILSPHEDSTRYPNNDKSKMGPGDYTEKSQIVSFSNYISMELEEIIEHINKIILNVKSQVNII